MKSIKKNLHKKETEVKRINNTTAKANHDLLSKVINHLTWALSFGPAQLGAFFSTREAHTFFLNLNKRTNCLTIKKEMESIEWQSQHQYEKICIDFFYS